MNLLSIKGGVNGRSLSHALFKFDWLETVVKDGLLRALPVSDGQMVSILGGLEGVNIGRGEDRICQNCANSVSKVTPCSDTQQGQLLTACHYPWVKYLKTIFSWPSLP